MEMLLVGCIAVFSICIFSAIAQLQNQVRNLQKKINAIAVQVGVEEPLPLDLQREIDVLLDTGKRIKAIKVYRQATGQSLKEASDTIDEHAKRRTS